MTEGSPADITNPTVLKTRFEKALETQTSLPLRFEWKINRSTMISVRQLLPQGWLIRLHPEFANAPSDTVQALGRYLLHRQKIDWQPIRAFALRIESPPSTRRKTAPLQPEGKVHDLLSLQKEVAETYFDGKTHARITWNPRHGQARKRKRRSITFGHYDPGGSIIRIHPALDDVRVDPEFIRFIIYHETLHALHPPILKGHRQWQHHTAFRKAEKQFADYDRMRVLSAYYLKTLPARRSPDSPRRTWAERLNL